MPYIGDPIKINTEKVEAMIEYNETLESMSHSELVEECRKLQNNITFIEGVWQQRMALEKEISEATYADYRAVLSMYAGAERLIKNIYDSMYTHKVMLPDDVASQITEYMSVPF
jgi:hypothetical protein